LNKGILIFERDKNTSNDLLDIFLFCFHPFDNIIYFSLTIKFYNKFLSVVIINSVYHVVMQ